MGRLLSANTTEALNQARQVVPPNTTAVEQGTYMVEWFSLNSRETKSAGNVTVESNGNMSFTPPFPDAGPAVLYLKQVERR